MSRSKKTTATTEDAKPVLAPKLRFPGFKEAASWDSTILGGLSEVVRGGSPRPIDGFLTTDADGLNWLKIGYVDKEAKFVTQTAEKVRPEALSKTRVVNTGDLILSNSMSFGRPYILQIKTCIHDGWIAITDISKNADRDFLYYLISSPSSQSYFVDNAAGSGVQNLNADIIKALPVCFPTPAEQQKIAECLSSVDELLAAQARKVDALKTHKKGLMQQLFPREGETKPRLRFPEFQNAGEWKPRALAEVCSSFSGGTPTTSEPRYYGGDIAFIRSAEIARDRTELFLTREGLLASSAKMVAKGDVLVALYGANSGDVAIAKIGGAINQAILCLKSKESDYFIYQFLSFKKDWIVATYLQGGQGNLSGEIVKSIEVWFPSPDEQQRIASSLSSLDALITAETQKLESLKTHKKGLMQQLFPSPEEVEG
ncbi:MAG TPA: restriction endonuclease subunit S [Planctomycetota bacterium]|nr:restriction endonuclease subunit S [Planctomycetota bacterium]